MGIRILYRRVLALLILCGAVLVAGCKSGECVDPASLIPPQDRYSVRIIRDSYGVPHIYGKTDADVAYGLAWAHSEDDFETILETLMMVRGRYAAHVGREGLPFDYLLHLFRFREIVDQKYMTDLSAEMRAVCEAYADGFNHYAVANAKEVPSGILPVTGRDVVTGFVMRSPFFFGMEQQVRRLMGPKRQQEVSRKEETRVGGALSRELPIGSNTFAVSPKRTPDGKTHLAINSHQPWEGPLAWYEVRLHSETGLDIVGGVFPGSPVILHGHNRNLGWAHTVNMPDLCDIYVLEMHPTDPYLYLFDGEYRELERETVAIPVKLWGNLRITIRKEILRSVHGPVLRRPHGVYAIRYAGYGDIRQVEQWYRMGKAQDIDEFEQAMRMRALPSFNVGYADREGNIWYIYNALLPLRAPGYDWRAYLPGDTSETLWTDYLPFEQMPQVRNPETGFIQNCNSTPFKTTMDPENPDPNLYCVTLGIEGPEVMTNRALRALELFGNDESISEEEFYEYKFDWKYSEASEAAKLRQDILENVTDDDPVIREALDVLQNWNLAGDPHNTGAAVAVLSMEPVVRAKMFGQDPPDLYALFRERARMLKENFGRIDVPWSNVNRLVRGQTNIGLGGGPDLLHAVYGDWEGAYLRGVAGDCYVLMVTWDPDGRVRSRSIHQYGSATLREDSPHFADQALLFALRKMKPVWLDYDELRQHSTTAYRPGEHRETLAVR